MRIVQDIPVPLLKQGRNASNVRRLVARVLLERARDSTLGRPRLTQRDIAAVIGADWEMVHMSLRSLENEGAIRIERHRIIVNERSLQRMANG
jgi:DNA-binding GntR family transcriptional regulator